MATKWRKKKGSSGKIDYKNGHALRSPCQCKRMWRVALWQEVGQGAAADFTTFKTEPYQTALPGNSNSQFYTREPIPQAPALQSNYDPPASVCQPLIADGGTIHRSIYPGSAVYAALNFTVAAAADWKLENIYSEKWIVSYFLLDYPADDTYTLYPAAAAMIALLPATWTKFQCSFGTGYKDISELTTASEVAPDPCPDNFTGMSESLPVPTTTETNIAPNSPYKLHTVGRDEVDFFQEQVGPNHVHIHYHAARCYFVVCKFTDFKFFNTLTVRCKRIRPNGSVGRSYIVLTTYQLTLISEFNDIVHTRIAVEHPLGTNNYEQIDISLTGHLLRNGRDLWLYFVPGPLPELASGNPTPRNAGLCTRSGGVGYPTVGDPTDAIDTDIIKDIELIPTFTYGGTP